MAQLNKFCCCCTTRTGTLVIGTIGWIITLAQIFTAMDPRDANRDAKLAKEFGVDDSDYDSDIQTSIYVKVGYGLIALLVCVLLVVGVYKKDKRYMLPWLVLKGLESTLISILTVIIFFIACMNGHGVLFAIFFVCLIVAVLNWYFWMCVWSHYKELGEGTADVNTAVYSTPNTAPPQYMEKPFNIA